MNLKSLLLCLLTIGLLSSCKKDQLKTDIDTINDYLEENGLTAEQTASGLHYIIEDLGIGGGYPQYGNIIQVNYKGYFTDGTVFSESEPGEPIEGIVGQTFIPGWNEGLQYFQKGGEGVLLIPSKLAYGSSGSPSGDIAPNTVLIFDIEVVDF